MAVADPSHRSLGHHTCAVCGEQALDGGVQHRDHNATHRKAMVWKQMLERGFAPLVAMAGAPIVEVGYFNRVCVAAGITPRARRSGVGDRTLWVPRWVEPLLRSGLKTGSRPTAQEANARARLLHLATHDRELRAAWTALTTVLDTEGMQAWIEREGHQRFNATLRHSIARREALGDLSVKGKPLDQRRFRIGDRIA